MAKTYLVTRPRLASRLTAAGIEGKQTVNPWNERTAWEYLITPDFLRIAQDYFKQIDKPLPQILQRAAQELSERGKA